MLDLNLESPAQDLALEEALLEECDRHAGPEVLRFWEPRQTFAVLGYANHAPSEVNLEACRSANVTILRRVSGGGTVLQAPGCLNYAVVLRVDRHPMLQTIAGTTRYVLERQIHALRQLTGLEVQLEGDTDLAVNHVKCSGNSQRRKLNAVLFHGTLLLHVDLSLIERFLPMPSRQPPYRANRQHRAFLRNLGLEAHTVKEAIAQVWEAVPRDVALPRARLNALVSEKYGRPEWNLERG